MGDIEDWTGDVHEGDAAEVLSEMPESSIHSAITSPPYYGLRDYDVEGQIGLEDTLGDYIDNLVEVGRELRRVLRDDGSWWLNIGDAYNSGRGDHYGGFRTDTSKEEQGYVSGSPDDFLERKCKLFVPHRTAIALCEDGWVCRNDVVWAKPNPMPSSVKDRLNTTFEFFFHLTPEPDYWYDLDAIREPHQSKTEVVNEPYDRDENNAEKHPDANHSLNPDAGHPAGKNPGDVFRTDSEGTGENIEGEWDEETGRPRHTEGVTGGNHPMGKNPGDVFNVTTKPFGDAHFAVYPPELIEKPLKSSCPPRVCVECGAPHERIVERTTEYNSDTEFDGKHDGDDTRADAESGGHDVRRGVFSSAEFKGWEPTCDCDADHEPGIVLDPFIGSGTTAVVAQEHNRRWVGIDLNPDYQGMMKKRLMDEANYAGSGSVLEEEFGGDEEGDHA